MPEHPPGVLIDQFIEAVVENAVDRVEDRLVRHLDRLMAETRHRAKLDPRMLWTREEVAHALRMNIRTLDDYTKRGEIAVVRTDGRALFRPVDVEQFIENRRIREREREPEQPAPPAEELAV